MKDVNDKAKSLAVQWRILDDDDKESIIDACYDNDELRILVCAMLTTEEEEEFEKLIDSRDN